MGVCDQWQMLGYPCGELKAVTQVIREARGENEILQERQREVGAGREDRALLTSSASLTFTCFPCRAPC